MNSTILNLLVDDCYTNNKKAREKEIECKCGWKGKREDAIPEPYNNMRALSGCAGILFKCPSCSEVANNMLIAMS